MLARLRSLGELAFRPDLTLPDRAEVLGAVRQPQLCSHRLHSQLGAVVGIVPPGAPATRHGADRELERFLDAKRPDAQLRRHEPDQAPGERLFQRPAIELVPFRGIQRHHPAGGARRAIDGPIAGAAMGADCGQEPISQGAIVERGAAPPVEFPSPLRLRWRNAHQGDWGSRR